MIRLIIFALFVSYFLQNDSRWVKIGETSTDNISADTSSTHITKEHYIQIWTKEQPKPEFLKKVQEDFAEKISKEFISYAYTLDLLEFSCSTRRFKILSSISYNTSGEVILQNSDGEEKAQWRYPAPNTKGDVLINLFCGRH